MSFSRKDEVVAVTEAGIKTLALMMISCKKMADLANDNGTNSYNQYQRL